MNQSRHTQQVKAIAQELDFSFCGISKAEPLNEEAHRLEQWLQQGNHGQMEWMENHFDLRTDPAKLVPGAKSVVSLLYNYYPEEHQPEEAPYKVSKYAYGRDYHKVVRKKLKYFLLRLRGEIGEIQGRGFVDSAPVMDKVWAQRSGLGWLGKHTNLINKRQGSFLFVANLITDLELEPDGPATDHCGSCTRCIDACPTGAITEPYMVDGSRCISYLTIELKEQIPEEFRDKMEGWVFGCDICQDVCPWNRHATPTQEADFQPKPAIFGWNERDWEEVTEEVFNKMFEGTALRRTKYEGLRRNLDFIRKTGSARP